MQEDLFPEKIGEIKLARKNSISTLSQHTNFPETDEESKDSN
jgi:hypothetical protein